MLRAFLTARVPELKVVLSDDEALWDRCKSEPDLIAANEWLATQLFTILQAEGCIANQNFLADVRSSHTGALSDGRELARLILREGRHIHPGLELQTQEQFDTLCAKSFKAGASLEQIKHDANAIREMWEILPEGAKTRDHDLLFRLIAAMPVNDRRIKDERLKMHLELRTAQAHGNDPPWTFTGPDES